MAERGKPSTIKKELAWAVPFLHSKGIKNPRLEAEVLLAGSLAWDRVRLLAHLTDPVSPSVSITYRQWVKKRAAGYPLQYLTGCQEFMSLEFEITPGVLIPRDDTEVLVETVLGLKPKVGANPAIVDVGTGSGIIGVALKKYWPAARLYAVDISSQALKVARTNALRHQVEIDFYLGDLLTPFSANHSFDIIVSNPPYIPSRAINELPMEVTKEPHLALDGGANGLDFYPSLARDSQKLLVQEGWLAVEIGSDQGAEVVAIFKDNGFTQVQLVQDYAGLDRVVLGQLRVKS